jgi:hypothetical protein
MNDAYFFNTSRCPSNSEFFKMFVYKAIIETAGR